jgi:hypothetical protein
MVEVRASVDARTGRAAKAGAILATALGMSNFIAREPAFARVLPAPE